LHPAGLLQCAYGFDNEERVAFRFLIEALNEYGVTGFLGVEMAGQIGGLG
jgi:hypothetical protein